MTYGSLLVDYYGYGDWNIDNFEEMDLADFSRIFLRYSGVPASGQQCTFMAVGTNLQTPRNNVLYNQQLQMCYYFANYKSTFLT